MTTEELPIEVTIKSTSHYKTETKMEVYFDKSLITGKIGDDVKNSLLTSEGNLKLCRYLWVENSLIRHKRVTDNYMIDHLKENLCIFFVDNETEEEPEKVKILYSFMIPPHRLILKRNWYEYYLYSISFIKKISKIEILGLFTGLTTELYKRGMRYT